MARAARALAVSEATVRILSRAHRYTGLANQVLAHAARRNLQLRIKRLTGDDFLNPYYLFHVMTHFKKIEKTAWRTPRRATALWQPALTGHNMDAERDRLALLPRSGSPSPL